TTASAAASGSAVRLRDSARPSSSIRIVERTRSATAGSASSPSTRSGLSKPSRTTAAAREPGREPERSVIAASGLRSSQGAQVALQLELSDLVPVGLPLLALVAQEEVE